MKTEEALKKKFEQFKREEEEAKEIKVQNFLVKAKVFFTILFLSQYAIIIKTFLWVASLTYALDKSCHEKSIISAATPEAVALSSDFFPLGTALFCVFIGFAIIAWMVSSIVYWFDGWSDVAWLNRTSRPTENWYRAQLRKKEIKKNEKSREEFLKFYELYTTDEDFKEQYNIMYSKSSEKEDFLKRLKDDPKPSKN